MAIDDIKTGELLSESNIWVKRPGTGEIQAADFQKLLGKKAIKLIRKDEHLSQKDFE